MQLYYVDDKGELIKIGKLEFIDTDVYVVDDNRAIFIWVGLNVSQDKKEISADIARKLENERGKETKILIMKRI